MNKRIALILIIVSVIGAFWYFDLARFVELEPLTQWVEQEPIQAGLAFALIYLLVASLSLPGAGPLSLIAGAVFGLWYGVLIVSFASTIGATIAMLISRSLLRDWVQRKFSGAFEKVNDGVRKDGALYLFILRLIPPIPFFVINLVFGLTKLPARTFYWVSQLGMFPATVLYINVGAQLGAVENISFFEVFKPEIIASFAALIAFPLIVKAILKHTRFANSNDA